MVKKELKEVEAQIRDQVRAFDPSVEPYVDYICNTSGKRIRPILSILAGGATGGVKSEHIKIGVILELVHMSTLVHDDIIDGADTRRNEQNQSQASRTEERGPENRVGRALFLLPEQRHEDRGREQERPDVIRHQTGNDIDRIEIGNAKCQAQQHSRQ